MSECLTCQVLKLTTFDGEANASKRIDPLKLQTLFSKKQLTALIIQEIFVSNNCRIQYSFTTLF